MSDFKVVRILDGSPSFRVIATDESLVVDINLYLQHLATRGRSAYTLKSYARGLVDFINWLDEQQISLKSVNSQHIEKYIGEFARSKKGGACQPNPEQAGQIHPKTRKAYPDLQRKNTTINHRLSVLTGFFEYCINRDNLRGEGGWQYHTNPVNPSANLGSTHGMIGRDQPRRNSQNQFRRRKTRLIPKQLAPELAEQLIDHAASWRDKAIITLLFRTGQRIGDWSEFAGQHGILGMTTADVDEVSGTITVRLKVSRDEHRVPVTDDFWTIYHQYLKHERGNEPGSALWITLRKSRGKPLTYATFESAIRYIGRKLNINVNAHMFRHTLAQGILNTTGNLKVAQEILGHENVSTTADQYMHVDEAAMVKALREVKAVFDGAVATAIPVINSTSSAEAINPTNQLQQYAFPYDAITIEELENAYSGNGRHQAGMSTK